MEKEIDKNNITSRASVTNISKACDNNDVCTDVTFVIGIHHKLIGLLDNLTLNHQE